MDKKVESILEKIGIKYFSYLSDKLEHDHIIQLKNIPSDKVLQVVVNNISVNAVIIALLVGALTTVPAVVFEIYFKRNFTTFTYYSLLSTITIFLVIEVSILLLGRDEKYLYNSPSYRI